jgi:triacylglycerol esterase/lipase EstA (alpha/beta hydrolase family)
MKRVSSFSALAIMSVVMLISAVAAIVAQDREYGDKQQQTSESKRSGPTASGSSRGSLRTMDVTSPFPMPSPTDSQFVFDTQYPAGHCQFRSEGSLKFTVAITRYVGLTNGEGKLTNPQGLVNNGVISPTVTLTMPAYDVDYSTVTFPPDQPERDRILFNGEYIGDLGAEGYLTGENNRWRMNTIEVPVAAVKFAQRDPNGGPPTPGLNEIEILIDQGNIANNKELWCTSIDWAALKVKALYPVVMLHGNGESGTFWNRLGFTGPFVSAGIPIDISVSNPTQEIKKNVQLLAEKIPPIATKFGVKHLHFVAHSKGGLDSRGFLKTLKTEGQLAILSMTTLSTPHHGSALADYIRDAQGASAWSSEDSTRTLFMQKIAGDYDEGRKNLTTDFVAGFNQTNLPLPQSFIVDGETTQVKYFSWGADANADNSMSLLGNPTITNDELAGTGHDNLWYLSEWGGNLVYRTLYYVASTRWEWAIVGGKFVRVVRETQNQTVQPNDMLVTITSSKIEPYIPMTDMKKNHATVADAEMGQLVLQLIKTIQPLPQQ